MADVFLSYSRLDRPAAEALSKALETRGWSVWWDRKISAGAAFDKTIERELESATCIIVLWSKSSIDSEWVRNEAAAAVERNALIPAQIEDVRPPIEFRRKQTIDLSRWDRTSADPILSVLLDDVAEKLGSLPKYTDAHTAAPKHRHRPSWKIWALGGAGAVATAICGVLLWPGKSTDYTLVCKGGGPFGIQMDGLFSVRIVFVPAQGPALETMAPGQCAWTDRAVNADEPNVMCYSGLSAYGLPKRFAAGEMVRQQAHFDPAGRCLKITQLL